jgi:hypothetical protein
VTLPRGLLLSTLLPGLLVGIVLTGKETSPRNEIRVDFNAHPEGPYEMRVFRKDWTNASLGQFHRQAAITAEPKGKSLRISYPKGSLGPNEGGGVFRQKLDPLDSRRLSYRVLFEKGFDFRRGGKLPGLGGGKANTGGNKPTGDGWSARYMWGEDGKLGLYLYHLDQKTKYGERIELKAKAIPGKWFKLEQVVQVNSPGKVDGRIRVWIDDKLALDRKGLRLRGKVDPEVALVDQFLFSTFHGGSTRKWAPVRDSHARFDDFVLTPSP